MYIISIVLMNQKPTSLTTSEFLLNNIILKTPVVVVVVLFQYVPAYHMHPQLSCCHHTCTHHSPTQVMFPTASATSVLEG